MPDFRMCKFDPCDSSFDVTKQNKTTHVLFCLFFLKINHTHLFQSQEKFGSSGQQSVIQAGFGPHVNKQDTVTNHHKSKRIQRFVNQSPPVFLLTDLPGASRKHLPAGSTITCTLASTQLSARRPLSHFYPFWQKSLCSGGVMNQERRCS